MTAGTKHDVLTENELSGFRLQPAVMSFLDECAARAGLPRQSLRVLDWGCGRGRTVIKLLEAGFDAWGVDLDAEPLANGAALLRTRGHDPDQRLVRIEQDYRTPFGDGYFHAVFSEQVFEHVHDLDTLATELGRITATSGGGLHVFPAKWSIVEPHLHVPFVHWLPKGRLRYWYLRMLVARVPAWRELEQAGPAERARTYHEYLLNKTFYRPLRGVRRSLTRAGFDVNERAARRPGRLHKLCFPFLLFKSEAATRFWNWWSNNFHVVMLAAVRRDGGSVPGGSHGR